MSERALAVLDFIEANLDRRDMATLPFPLDYGPRQALLTLPTDLQPTEAERMCSAIKTWVIPLEGEA